MSSMLHETSGRLNFSKRVVKPLNQPQAQQSNENHKQGLQANKESSSAVENTPSNNCSATSSDHQCGDAQQQ